MAKSEAGDPAAAADLQEQNEGDASDETAVAESDACRQAPDEQDPVGAAIVDVPAARAPADDADEQKPDDVRGPWPVPGGI